MENDVDAVNVFGVPKPRTPQQEVWHREMARRSLDIIRVKNPDKEDFFVEWDHRFHRVPGNATADLPRYIATTYCRDKATDIINKMNQKLHDEFIEARRKKGLPEYTDKNVENNETYMTQTFPKGNDRVLLTKIYGQLWVGLVTEFGKDEPTMNNNARQGEVDLTPLEQKILMDLENRKVDLADDPQKEVKEEPVFGTFDKEEVLEETKKNDKK